ncbi:RDD family protein [Microbacterium terrisoli]|jgi:uncharacterized RDD family membrane protein YckC|uniref:RDD family protein n=1 Tax=Microbacterium terrisoli TaxID=3242192 RepID=UPI002803C3DF|nr:RDD family protein [Microbacterium protaetiae]
MTAHRHPGKRLAAWVIDWCLILVWAGILAAVAVPFSLTGDLHALTTVWGNLLSAIVLVVPVTLAFAGLESSRHAATIGKRALHLRVTDSAGARIGFARALGRNALKIALPWLIGHSAVYEIVATSVQAQPPAWVWVLTAAAYLLPIAWIVSLFVGAGRTPYDRATGTAVRSISR